MASVPVPSRAVSWGRTDHHRAKADARAIWEDTRRHWFDHGVTDSELYHFATKAAEDRGWSLNLDLSGHRLSDFPHSAHYDGSIADVPLPIAPGSLGARDRDYSSRPSIRGLLRGSTPRGPILSRVGVRDQLNHLPAGGSAGADGPAWGGTVMNVPAP